MEEQWAEVPYYSGYQASTLGRVRRKEGKVTVDKNGKVRRWSGKILTGRGPRRHTGYRVKLFYMCEGHELLVARVVAMTFLGMPKDGETVNHKDGDRLNNRIENLEWISRADNIRHGFDNGMYKNICLPVKLIRSDGYEIAFRSCQQASLYLGKSRSYVNGTLHSNTIAIGDDGATYIAVQERMRLRR